MKPFCVNKNCWNNNVLYKVTEEAHENETDKNYDNELNSSYYI